MALDKAALKASIKQLLKDMEAMNTTESNQADASEYFATQLSGAIDTYVKSGTVTANPAAVEAAAMSNSGGPVVASNNLISTIS